MRLFILDLARILGAVKLQLILVIVLGLLSVGIGYMAPFYYLAVSAPIGLVILLIIVWAGYAAAKTLSAGPVVGGVAGVIVMLIGSIIQTVLSIPLIGLLMSAAMPPELAGTVGAGMGTFLVGAMIVGIIINLVIAFVLGLIGGYIGRAK